MSSDVLSPPTELSADWMAWLVLRHFLPAVAQREVLRELVSQVSGGSLQLEQLVDELMVSAPLWNDAWVFRERASDERGADRLANYLHRVLSSVAWQNDAGGGWFAAKANDASDSSAALPEVVDLLLGLSVADFSTPESVLQTATSLRPRLQPAVLALLDAFFTARHQPAGSELDSMWNLIEQHLHELPTPLRFVATKHLADLFVDADRWKDADEGYRRANVILEGWHAPSEFWTSMARAWAAMNVQTRATALRILRGEVDEAHALLPLTDGKLASAPLAAMNASLDTFVARSHPTAEWMRARDSRVRELRNPLLVSQLTTEHAMRLWRNGKHQEAHRHWWAVLRRQIALGAEHEARLTRALYARTMFDELRQNVKKDLRPDAFSTASRLIVESGHVEATEALEWPSDFVDVYVTDAVVDDLLTRIRRFEGTRTEREKVAVVLLRAWTELLSPSSRELGEKAWRAIADLALHGEVNFHGVQDVGRPAFEALVQLARRRPEWIHNVAAAVGAAVLRKLDPDKETRLGHEAALKAANEYVRAMDEATARRVTLATLDLLDTIDPERGMFLVVRPAIGLLVSKRVKDLTRTDGELTRRVFDTILRFGTADETETRRVIFYLHDFDRALLSDQSLRFRLKSAIEETRRSALNIGSSVVCEAIDALLIAPTLSQKAGLLDALDGLHRVVSSASSTRPSLGLADAYDSILDLCSYSDAIRRELDDDSLWRELVTKLAEAVAAMWRQAHHTPVLLAPFSLPSPTRAHPVVAHNWAVATRRFVEVFGHSELLDSALQVASSSPELAPHLLLASATRAIVPGATGSPAEMDEVRTDNREGFYTALGRWLVRLHQVDAEKADELAEVLLNQVLRFGPRPVDAAVLLAAFQRRGHRRSATAASLGDYSTRLATNRDLDLLLRPILNLVKGGG